METSTQTTQRTEMKGGGEEEKKRRKQKTDKKRKLENNAKRRFEQLMSKESHYKTNCMKQRAGEGFSPSFIEPGSSRR